MEAWYAILIKAIAVVAGGALLSIITAGIARKVLGKITKRTRSLTDDYIATALVNLIKPLGILISCTIAWKSFPINTSLDFAVISVAKLIGVVICVRTINLIILKLVQRWAIHIDDKAISSMVQSLSPMVRALVWCIGIIFYLQNIGVKMAAIWALLSAGGIGAGLALKEPVQEFFEYITILLDKPFQNGQFINIDNVWATVESVGVRSTRLKSINGEIIILSNSYLTNGVISNYTKMKNRRLVHKIGVVYDTPISKVKEIPNIIKEIIDSTEDTKFDRCHFIEFGPSSLDFEFVYYIPTNNYIRAMQAQERVNLGIMNQFHSNNIDFAFPTRTLHITK